MTDLRKFKNTYVCKLSDAPDNVRFRHCREGVFAVKNCDAYQTTPQGKTVIFSRRDLVEVFK
jgi:hypothetical protein